MNKQFISIWFMVDHHHFCSFLVLEDHDKTTITRKRLQIFLGLGTANHLSEIH